MEFEDLLRRLLDDWRMVEAVEKFGVAVAKDRGPGLIMPGRIIERVVDCAHYEKIKNLQDLRRETGWNCPDEIGSTVIAIVAGHGRPPAPVQTKAAPPLQVPQTTSAATPSRGILTTNTIVVNAQPPPICSDVPSNASNELASSSTSSRAVRI